MWGQAREEHLATPTKTQERSKKTDREPSSARSRHKRGRTLKLIPRRFRGRTRCEPRTARGPFLLPAPAFWSQCRDAPRPPDPYETGWQMLWQWHSEARAGNSPNDRGKPMHTVTFLQDLAVVMI